MARRRIARRPAWSIRRYRKTTRPRARRGGLSYLARSTRQRAVRCGRVCRSYMTTNSRPSDRADSRLSRCRRGRRLGRPSTAPRLWRPPRITSQSAEAGSDCLRACSGECASGFFRESAMVSPWHVIDLAVAVVWFTAEVVGFDAAARRALTAGLEGDSHSSHGRMTRRAVWEFPVGAPPRSGPSSAASKSLVRALSFRHTAGRCGVRIVMWSFPRRRLELHLTM